MLERERDRRHLRRCAWTGSWKQSSRCALRKVSALWIELARVSMADLVTLVAFVLRYIRVNPSGRLPFTIAKNETDYPTEVGAHTGSASCFKRQRLITSFIQNTDSVLSLWRDPPNRLVAQPMSYTFVVLRT